MMDIVICCILQPNINNIINNNAYNSYNLEVTLHHVNHSI